MPLARVLRGKRGSTIERFEMQSRTSLALSEVQDIISTGSFLPSLHPIEANEKVT